MDYQNEMQRAGSISGEWSRDMLMAQQVRQKEAYQTAIGAQCQNQIMGSPPANPDGIVGMTAHAHQCLEVLIQEIGRLRDRLSPVSAPIPEGAGGGIGSQGIGGEAPAVAMLRTLIERMAHQTLVVRDAIEALRI